MKLWIVFLIINAIFFGLFLYYKIKYPDKDAYIGWATCFVLGLFIFNGALGNSITTSREYIKPKYIYIQKLINSVYVKADDLKEEIYDFNFFLNPDSSKVFIEISNNTYGNKINSKIYIK